MNKDLLRVLVFQQYALEALIQWDDKLKAVKILGEAKYTLHKITRDINLLEDNELENNIRWFGEELGKEVTDLLKYFSKD